MESRFSAERPTLSVQLWLHTLAINRQTSSRLRKNSLLGKSRALSG
jgi:hypothetical protein